MAIRPKIQIDTPTTGAAISTFIKQLASIKGLTSREYALSSIYNGTDNSALKDLVAKELGTHSKYILTVYSAPIDETLKKALE